ncbi:MAG: phosphohistidine phosphatase SixA [Deltaproteobacteria bacterium]|nr:MAG: phosphohistidine phosphatase SixA [Deltaproteobacteria bacterium]
MRIYLVRHGIAVDPAEKGTLDDDARPLTGKGRRRFRRLARAFAQLGEKLDFIFTSPLVRAVQTAEILAGALKFEEVGVLDELRPEAGVGKLLAETARRVKDEQSVALVGHDPQMTQLVIALAGLPKEDAERVDFKKGSIVRIDVGELPSARPAQPRWWMKPRSRTLAKGVPLKKKPIEEKLSKARPTGSH